MIVKKKRFVNAILIGKGLHELACRLSANGQRPLVLGDATACPWAVEGVAFSPSVLKKGLLKRSLQVLVVLL